MSFSFYTEASAETFTQDVDAAAEKNTQANGPYNDGANELISIGVQAANAIKDALGHKAEKFSVSISGHGNPDHGPAEGYANEQLSVAVSVTQYRSDEGEGVQSEGTDTSG